MVQSTRPPAAGTAKPAKKRSRPKPGIARRLGVKKPRKDFPLFPDGVGYWSRKINGRVHRFGRWGTVVDGVLTPLPGRDHGALDALKLYKASIDDIEADRPPTAKLVNGEIVNAPTTDGCTVRELCNQFLTAMKARLDQRRKMSPRTFAEYQATTDRLNAKFARDRTVASLRPADFTAIAHDLAEQFGPVRRGNEVQKIKTVFNYAKENEWIAAVPRYGSEFKKPGKDELRKHRKERGKKLFKPEEIRLMLDALEGKEVTLPPPEDGGEPAKLKRKPNPTLRAMALLAINCGFGNTDCGTLTYRNQDGERLLDLPGGWINYPRPKTGIDRRCPLWPETVAAIRTAVEWRKHEGRHVFITKHGNPWTSEGGTTSVAGRFGKLLVQLGIDRPGVGFYALRHTFRTVADAALDRNAARTIMGHVNGDSIDDAYTEEIEDVRLVRVSDHVRKWLFG